MAEPLGKRKMIAWTICGVLAVFAATAYSKRSPAPPVQQMQTAIPATPPTISSDSARIRIGTRRYQTTLHVNDESRGSVGCVGPLFQPAP